MLCRFWRTPAEESAEAKIEKRPLLRPAIPSPYAGADQQKVVYIAAHTPFLSAVKRVEKLLHLADKRLVQSATTNASKQGGRGVKRKRGAGGDEILGIAEEVERMKGKSQRRGRDGASEIGVENDIAGEQVVLKGTGKAIHRVLELALWFQQRDQTYVVQLRTGSVGAIDDISIDGKGPVPGKESSGWNAEEGEARPEAEEANAMDLDGSHEDRRERHGTVSSEAPHDDQRVKIKRKRRRENDVLTPDEVPETRIRYASVLEAAVSLW